ncbi:unnamed protein product [Sphagnum balticum]
MTTLSTTVRDVSTMMFTNTTSRTAISLSQSFVSGMATLPTTVRDVSAIIFTNTTSRTTISLSQSTASGIATSLSSTRATIELPAVTFMTAGTSSSSASSSSVSSSSTSSSSVGTVTIVPVPEANTATPKTDYCVVTMTSCTNTQASIAAAGDGAPFS